MIFWPTPIRKPSGFFKSGLILIAGVFIIIDVRYFVGNFEKVSKFPKKARNHLFLVFCLAIFNTEKHQLMYISHFITITH